MTRDEAWAVWGWTCAAALVGVGLAWAIADFPWGPVSIRADLDALEARVVELEEGLPSE